MASQPHSPPEQKPTSAEGMMAARIVWPALGLLMFVIMLRPVSPHDIWFILLMGSKTLEMLAVPQHEFFLYTADGAPDLFGTWGFGVLMELARRAMGLYGLVFLNAALWALAYLFLFMSARLRLGRSLHQAFGLPEIIGILVATALLYEAVMHRSWMRPEVTVFLAWGVICFLMELARRRGDFRQALLLFPLILWGEAWLHTAGTILLVPFAAYCCEFLFKSVHSAPGERRFSTVLRATWPWGVSFLAALILPIFNPNGIGQVYAQLDMFLQVLTDKKGIISGQGIASPGLPLTETLLYNIEYLPAWKWPLSFHLYALLISIGLCLIVMEKRRVVSFLSITPVAVFALLHIRGAGLFAWSLLLPLSVMAVELFESSFRRMLATRRTQHFEASIASICLLLAIGWMVVVTYREGLTARFPLQLPLQQGMAKIVARYPDGGNVFTEMHLGAIAAWSLGSKYKVSLSAHVYRAPPELTHHVATVTFVRPGWEAELDRFHVIAVFSNINDLVDGHIKPIGLRLAYSEDWDLSTTEDNTVTFIRRSASGDRPSAMAQLRQIERYWGNVSSGAKAIYAYTPYPKAERAIRVSQAFLGQLARNDLTSDEKLARVEEAAKRLPEWGGDISASTPDPDLFR